MRTPVSYTHLDVYKRQPFTDSKTDITEKHIFIRMHVSNGLYMYTHTLSKNFKYEYWKVRSWNKKTTIAQQTKLFRLLSQRKNK